jgi:hypothetical protein
LFVASLMVKAQGQPLTNEAAKLCQEKQFDLAVQKIEEAKASPVESLDSYTWYVDGFIQKEIYKQNDIGVRNSKHREMAAESLLKALELDKKNQHSAMIKLSLKFLASSYYNDALLQTQEFDLTNNSTPEETYIKFKKFMHYAEPGTSLKKFDKEFNKNMGQRYFALWQLDVDNEILSDKSVEKYSEVLRLDSTESDAYYNIAVVYYNHAVFKYRKIGPDTDIFDLIVIQQECADLIKNRALVNMQKAYKLTPERGDVVRGLMYMHRALEHENDVEYFKKEIERLISEGKITAPDK